MSVRDPKALLAARERFLITRPTRSIAASLGRLSSLWLQKNYFYRRSAARRLVEGSALTPRMAEALLDGLFRELTETKLLKLLHTELGSVEALDGFSRRVGAVRAKATGPSLLTHVFAANVPNPAVQSFVFGMLLKSANAGKVSSRDRGILDLYLESLEAADPRLNRANTLLDASDRRGLVPWLSASEGVIAYGDDETLCDLRKKTPAKAFFEGYGSRLSVSIFFKEALGKNEARLAARDVWMMDQRGCLSPLVFYVERGKATDARCFSGWVAEELSRLGEGEVPRRSTADLARLETLKDRLRLRALRSGQKNVWESRGRGHWTVGYEEKTAIAPDVSGLQCVHVRAFSREDEVYRALLPFRGSLQAAAVEGPARRRLSAATALAALGVNRVCRAGRMQFPPILWHHDGRLNLGAWVRWTDFE